MDIKPYIGNLTQMGKGYEQLAPKILLTGIALFFLAFLFNDIGDLNSANTSSPFFVIAGLMFLISFILIPIGIFTFVYSHYRKKPQITATGEM